jgi:hypothetical protein
MFPAYRTAALVSFLSFSEKSRSREGGIIRYTQCPSHSDLHPMYWYCHSNSVSGLNVVVCGYISGGFQYRPFFSSLY